MESVCGHEPWPEYLATKQTQVWVKLCDNYLNTEKSNIFVRFLTMCPSLAATKHTRLPLKNVPFSEPKADNAAATDMIQPQLPSTLFLWGGKKLKLFEKLQQHQFISISVQMLPATSKMYIVGLGYIIQIYYYCSKCNFKTLSDVRLYLNFIKQ